MKALMILCEGPCSTWKFGNFKLKDREIVKKYCDWYRETWLYSEEESAEILEIDAPMAIDFINNNCVDYYEDFMEYLKENT